MLTNIKMEASVYVLHLGKITGIMSSVLTTLETNDTNRVNKDRSHMDGEDYMA